MRDRLEAIRRILPEAVRRELAGILVMEKELQEIRLRQGQPLTVRLSGRERVLDHRVTEGELRETMELAADYSLYAFENELRQGFLTIEGGHRLGVAGQVIREEGRVRNFQEISSVNIRVCHAVEGCADPLFPAVLEEGEPCHTLILSPPGCGKTTLLRDLVRQLSDGNACLKGRNVSVVDERSEIGGCLRGVPQNRLGMRTDILDHCPKAEGMRMLLRSLSPQVLAVDEIGSGADVEAVADAMHCGVTVLATVHGSDPEELRGRPRMEALTGRAGFRRYVVLEKAGGPGRIRGIYDQRGRSLCM